MSGDDMSKPDMGPIYGDKDKGLSYDFDELKDAQTRRVDSTDELLASRGPATTGSVDLSAIKAADPSFDDQDFITIARESFYLVRRARTADHEKFDEGLLSPQLAREVKTAIDGDVASHQHHLLPGLEIRTAEIAGGQVTDGKLSVTVRLHLWVGSTNPDPAAVPEKGTEWDEDWTFWRDPTIDASATDRDHATRRQADGGWMFAHKGWVVTSILRDGADAAAG
jgi:predicted lipid-binding transport protein (Tim44 family)